MSRMRLESLKSERQQQRSLEDVSEKDTIESYKAKSELMAHVSVWTQSRLDRAGTAALTRPFFAPQSKAEKEKYDKERKKEQSHSKMESLKHVKAMRSFVEDKEREALESDRLQAELTRSVRVTCNHLHTRTVLSRDSVFR